jgi:hypothetical protein
MRLSSVVKSVQQAKLWLRFLASFQGGLKTYHCIGDSAFSPCTGLLLQHTVTKAPGLSVFLNFLYAPARKKATSRCIKGSTSSHLQERGEVLLDFGFFHSFLTRLIAAFFGSGATLL